MKVLHVREIISMANDFFERGVYPVHLAATGGGLMVYTDDRYVEEYDLWLVLFSNGLYFWVSSSMIQFWWFKTFLRFQEEQHAVPRLHGDLRMSCSKKELILKYGELLKRRLNLIENHFYWMQVNKTLP